MEIKNSIVFDFQQVKGDGQIYTWCHQKAVPQKVMLYKIHCLFIFLQKRG